MALVDHLRELRRRVVTSVLAMVVTTAVAAFFHRELTDFLLAPLPSCSTDGLTAGGGRCGVVSTIGLLTPFTLALKVSLTAGVVAAAPVWLHQLWAFVSPGLHKHERRYSIAFLAAGTPLFVAGAALAYLVLPATAGMLASFAPGEAVPIMPIEDYLDVATRMVLVFGAAFELPLLLVMLNLIGVLTGRRLFGWWRGMVMGITVFTAFATPSPEPLSMLALAAPIWALYFLAAGIALLNDRRQARRALDTGLSDEEASHLDLVVEDVADPEQIESPAALPPASRREHMDDVT